MTQAVAQQGEGVSRSDSSQVNGTAQSIGDGHARRLPTMISARRTVELLAPLVGGHANAKVLIVDRLRDGVLRAFALQIWRTKGQNLKAIWAAGAPNGAQRKVPIRKSSFQQGASLIDDAAEWDWRKGRFAVTVISTRGRFRIMMEKVQFARDDIELLLRKVSNKQGAGGRPVATAAWQAFWLEIIDLARDGTLDFEHYPSRETLRHDVFVRLGWDKNPSLGLSSSTLIPAVRSIWDRFVEPTQPRQHS